MPLDIIDYSNTVFYKIYCKDPAVKDLYVGHTTNFVQRKYNHKRTCIKENDSNHNLKIYKFIRDHGGWDNWKMEIIGFQDCYDHYEARKVEQKYFETLKATLNSIDPLPKPKQRPAKIPKETKEKQVFHCDVCKTTCQTKKELFVHEETNKHKRNAKRITTTINSPKVAQKFLCENCNYKCNKQSDFNKHNNTAKHIKRINVIQKSPKSPKTHLCVCGKEYKYSRGLLEHKRKCYQDNNNNKSVTVQDVHEDKHYIIAQNKELMNLLVTKNHQTEFSCDCGKTYKHHSSLWKHKNKCSLIINNNNNNTVTVQENLEYKPSMMEILSQNKELMNLLVTKNHQTDELIQQNKELTKTVQEMVPKIHSKMEFKK